MYSYIKLPRIFARVVGCGGRGGGIAGVGVRVWTTWGGVAVLTNESGRYKEHPWSHTALALGLGLCYGS